MTNEKFKEKMKNPVLPYLNRMQKEMKNVFPKEYDIIMELLTKKQLSMKRITIRKKYGLSNYSASVVIDFFNYLQSLRKNNDIFNPKDTKIKNNYLYKWFIDYDSDSDSDKENSVEENNKIEEEVITMQKENKQIKQKITKEIVIKTKEILKNHTIKEAAEIINISTSSIFRIKNGQYDHLLENDMITNSSENKKESNYSSKEDKLDTEDFNTEDSIYIPRTYSCRQKFINFIECGLIKYRHSMPVDLFIFNKSLTDKEMSDFIYLDKLINKFIDDNVTFDKNGRALESLKLYATGLQCALAAVIKVCSYRKIGLEVMHYNPISCTYLSQKIFDASDLNNIINLKRYSHEIFYYDCNINDLTNSEYIYELRLVVPNQYNDTTLYSESTLSDDFYKILQFYKLIILDIATSLNNEFVSIRSYKKSDETKKFEFERQLLYSNNYQRIENK